MSDSEPTDVGPEALQRESAAPGALSSTSSSHSTPRPTANFFLPAAPSANGSGKKKKPRKRVRVLFPQGVSQGMPSRERRGPYCRV